MQQKPKLDNVTSQWDPNVHFPETKQENKQIYRIFA